MRKLYPSGPIFRISVAIISLIVALILAFDSFFDLLPNIQAQKIAIHKQISISIASQIAQSLAEDSKKNLQLFVDQLIFANPEITSIGIRREDHGVVTASKRYVEEWKGESDSISTPTHMIVPLYIRKAHFGDTEISFSTNESWDEWFHQPLVKFIFLFLTLGLVSVYLYLKRVLQYLDPSHAAPQSVKMAFNTLTESVLLINSKKHILLANAAFHKMTEGNTWRIEGKSIMQLDWLLKGFFDKKELSYPWDDALRLNQTVPPTNIKVTLPNGSERELIMNCSPINDNTGVARGCLTTFNDVTKITETNRQLQTALQELRISKDKIEEQNIELQKYANIDPLTGCINRRSFFGQAQPIFQNAGLNDENLYCIMADIDHFKSFNDKYGHSVGDAVIQQVVNAMRRSLRSTDLFCRYGGEEFCILLVGKEINAMETAERMRKAVEEESGPGVRTIEGLRITSSFGMSRYGNENFPKTLEELIDQADQALYDAKHSGRNRVALYAQN